MGARCNSFVRGAAGVLLVALAACGPEQEPPRWLELRQVRPQERVGVYLNERIVLHFSVPLDPDSVHPGSVHIVAGDGTPARGRLSVERDRVEFQPAPVLARDLSDGGYRPATRYAVELAGFPRADALRSDDGRVLAESLRWTFETVAVSEPRSGYVFEDSSPTSGSPVILRTPLLQPLQPIRLTCEEPIDPSTLWSEDFELLPELNFVAVGRTRGDAIPLVAKFVRNDEREPYKDDAAVIELTPRDRRLAPGVYALYQPKVRLRDFGGHPLRVLNAGYREPLLLRVEAAAPVEGGSLARHVESFIDVATRSAEVVPGVDGAARWSGNGRVEVCFPAAAGSGRDGDVSLVGALASADVHAVRLVLPQGEKAYVEGEGTVVLRCQGRLELDGELLERRAPEREGAPTLAEALQRLSERIGARPPTVSEALECLQREGVRATVLVAGGDISIRGRIESTCPLVLVAGGRIRVSSDRQLQARRLVFVDGGTRSLGYVDASDGGPAMAFDHDSRWTVDGPVACARERALHASSTWASMRRPAASAWATCWSTIRRRWSVARRCGCSWNWRSSRERSGTRPSSMT
ncbi:MAG: Ig-like domain-containing protein [Planctomycetota bacterium]|nr:Ig-like domain-containing protein [Planctomycetota bacterium]